MKRFTLHDESQLLVLILNFILWICREVPFPGMAGTGVLPFIRGIDLTLNDLEAEKFPEAMEDMTSLRWEINFGIL